jgi:hypothetical protein
MLELLGPISKPVLVIMSLLADRAWHVVECTISFKDRLKLLQYLNYLAEVRPLLRMRGPTLLN